MLQLGRLIVVGFVVLTIIYVVVSIWSRMQRRRKLAREWDDEIRQGDREAFIREGLEDYEDSFRRKLIWLIYIVPVVLIAVIIYMMNFY